KEVVLHDLFDGYTINHHEKNNPFRQMELEGVSLEDEINISKEFVKEACNRFKKVTSVSSNHNDFFDRWLMSNDWRYNPNRKEYLKYASIKASGEADEKGIYHYILDRLNIPNLNTLGYSETY